MKIDPRVYHAGLFLYCIFIFILSSIPGDNFPNVEFEFSDKIVHAVVYAILFCLFFYSLKNQSKYVRLRKFPLEYSLLFTALFGLSDEIHQYFVVNRSCEFYDWVADVAGGLIMFLIFKYINKKHKVLASVLFLVAIIGCSGTDNNSTKNSKPAVSLITEEAWLNLMPVIDSDGRNVFCFNLKLKFSGKSLDTNYTIKDFQVDLNNDVLKNKSFRRQAESVSDSGFVLNLYQSPDEIYLDMSKDYPEEATFTFKVMKNNTLIKSVKSQKLSILKTY